MDYAVEKCKDSEGNTRCSKPFLVSKSTCYQLEWRTEGALTHTTAEIRDIKSGELVFYRDTNGDWTPEKGEVRHLSYYACLEYRRKMHLLIVFAMCEVRLSRFQTQGPGNRKPDCGLYSQDL